MWCFFSGLYLWILHPLSNLRLHSHFLKHAPPTFPSPPPRRLSSFLSVSSLLSVTFSSSTLPHCLNVSLSFHCFTLSLPLFLSRSPPSRLSSLFFFSHPIVFHLFLLSFWCGSGVLRQTGNLGIVKLANVEVHPQDSKAMASVGVDELPQELKCQTNRPIMLAYRYLSAQSHVRLKVIKHEQLGVVEGVAVSTRFSWRRDTACTESC